MDERYDAAIFDFGGVLTTSVRGSFEAYERAVGLPQGTLLNAFLHREADQEPHYHLLERGEITEGEFFSRMIERVRAMTGAELAVPSDLSEFRRRMFDGLQPNAAMLDAAARIGRHYRTAILSNNVREWRDWRDMVAHAGFQVIVDSSEVGTRKPEPQIYHLTCRMLDVPPARAVFVDDIPWNVEGAEAIGLTAIRFTTTDEVLAALAACFPRAFPAERNGAPDA